MRFHRTLPVALLMLLPLSALAQVGPPKTFAATGDSITRAANSSGLGDKIVNSWATGTNAGVSSYALRLQAALAEGTETATNDAVSGQKIGHVGAQLDTAFDGGARPELISILIGANDACTRDETAMTPVVDFHDYAWNWLEKIRTTAPESRILIGSVPDVFQLWTILHDNPSAQQVWSQAFICQSMLANPTSTASADVDRRARVRQRIVDFNAQLEQLCAEYVHCHWDGNAAFQFGFTAAEVSTIDYFHPSVAGQTRLAEVMWNSGFDYSDRTSPRSTASEQKVSDTSSNITLTATDDVAVKGIELRRGQTGPWDRYVAPVALSAGETLQFRAVDVNGNTEPVQSFVIGIGQSGELGGTAPPPATPDTEPLGAFPGCGCQGSGTDAVAGFGALFLLLGLARRRAAVVVRRGR